MARRKTKKTWKSTITISAIGAGIGAVALVLIPGLFDLIIAPPPPPIFGVEDSFLNPNDPIMITATNDSARREEPLNVKWDGHFLKQAAKFSQVDDEGNYKWEFFPKKYFESIEDETIIGKFTRDGEHYLEVRFDDGAFQGKTKITFSSQIPVVEATLQNEEGKPDTRILSGKAATKLQSLEENIQVDVMFHNEGQPIQVALPVERKQDSEGRIYFEFNTPIVGLPQISRDDPRFSEPFFAFRVFDQAGNDYYSNLTYSQFIAPGTQQFGAGRIADIKMKKPKDLSSQYYQVSFLVAPKVPERETYKGKQAIDLKVTAVAQDLYRLDWTKLPEEISTNNPATIVMKDNKTVSVAFGNTYEDKVAPTSKKPNYQVKQHGKDGWVYKSKTVSAPQEKDKQVTTDTSLAQLPYSGVPNAATDTSLPPGISLPGMFEQNR